MSTKYLISLADKLSQKHFQKTASAGRFAAIIKDYDTGPLMIDDFIEGLKMASYESYKNGEGFSEETLKLLLKQTEIIGAALEAVKPELERIDAEIDALS